LGQPQHHEPLHVFREVVRRKIIYFIEVDLANLQPFHHAVVVDEGIFIDSGVDTVPGKDHLAKVRSAPEGEDASEGCARQINNPELPHVPEGVGMNGYSGTTPTGDAPERQIVDKLF